MSEIKEQDRSFILEDTNSLSLGVITEVTVDEFMRTSFEEVVEGNVISASYSFADGGFGEYCYEAGGKIRKFIASHCTVTVEDNGIVIIHPQSKHEIRYPHVQ